MLENNKQIEFSHNIQFILLHNFLFITKCAEHVFEGYLYTAVVVLFIQKHKRGERKLLICLIPFSLFHQRTG